MTFYKSFFLRRCLQNLFKSETVQVGAPHKVQRSEVSLNMQGTLLSKVIKFTVPKIQQGIRIRHEHRFFPNLKHQTEFLKNLKIFF